MANIRSSRTVFQNQQQQYQTYQIDDSSQQMPCVATSGNWLLITYPGSPATIIAISAIVDIRETFKADGTKWTEFTLSTTGLTTTTETSCPLAVIWDALQKRCDEEDVIM